MAYNGCTWTGQFYGIEGKQSEDWVARHNIVAVHEKDWQRLGMRVLRLKMGGKEIYARVLDLCADADCDGCCTDNLGGDGYLIDMEIHTARRFGRTDGTVAFQICQ